MKKPYWIILTVFIALTLFMAPFGYTEGFEGKIYYKIGQSNTKKTLELTYWIKQDQIRCEPATKSEEPQVIELINTKEKKFYFLSPKQKKYAEASLDSMESTNTVNTPPALQRTGRTETILGHSCEKWILKGGNAISEIWATKGLEHLQTNPSNEWSGNLIFLAGRETAKEGVLILRVVVKDVSGKTMATLAATRIDQTALPMSLFEIPADFQKVDDLDAPSLSQMGAQRNGTERQKHSVLNR